MRYPEDKLISEVIFENGSQKCGVRTPSGEKLFNFEIPLAEPWLILNSDGSEDLPKEVVTRLFGQDPEFGYALAINTVSGSMAIAHFVKDKRRYVIYLENLATRVPGRLPSKPQYLKQLGELKTAKRPFSLMLPDRIWRNLFDREIGFSGLIHDLRVQLNFGSKTVQLYRDLYREVSEWKV